MDALHRLNIAGRVFCFAAILGLGLLSGDRQVITTLIVIAVAATTAVYLSLTTSVATIGLVTAEAVVTGLVIGLALPGSMVCLPYLVVLTLIAGISRGAAGVSSVVVAQFFAILLVTYTAGEHLGRADVYRALSPWVLTSVGAGLLGAWFRSTGKLPQHTGDPLYQSAHRLLSQLRIVARRLSSGLDPITMAGHVVEVIKSATQARHVAVYVRTDGGLLSPLSYSDAEAPEILPPTLAITQECWTEAEPAFSQISRDPTNEQQAAFPLRVGSRVVGVVLARVPNHPSAVLLEEIMEDLDEHSLRLETALTFDEVRSIATVEERRRLAREIHDGIAQDVASLGYLVDDLISGSDDERLSNDLRALRHELTRVVSELRLSIFDLRSEVLTERGLGSALSDYVREVGARSNMTVHLTLDEAPTRLRATTEVELLRIAQEAITNARKHSGASNLWINCRVNPPSARVEIRDDGGGLARVRLGSYGLRIMRERAERLEARLEIGDATTDRSRPGTLVRVTLGTEPDDLDDGGSETLDGERGRDHSSAGRRS